MDAEHEAEITALIGEYRQQQQQHLFAAAQCDGAAIGLQNYLDKKKAAAEKAATSENAPAEDVA